MARGFESKDVEFQQAEAERAKTVRPPMTPAQRAADEKRKSLELARARACADLASARSPVHRQMLEQAIAALDAQLRCL